MMLVDPYLIHYVLDINLNGDYQKDVILDRALGGTGKMFIIRDLYLLENQIPYWIFQFMESLKSGKLDEKAQVARSPNHLLEFLRAGILTGRDINELVESKPHESKYWLRWRREKRDNNISSYEEKLAKPNRPFRSVTDLKAKGVRFCSSSECLKDIKFKSCYFYGELQLPTPLITDDMKYLFSNIIALETSPGVTCDLAVMSYVIFMKSLLVTTRDVKELREAGIFFSTLGSDEEVVELFKEIDTYGLNYTEYFAKVKLEIEKYCTNKAKTWMAELIHTYFHSPWTVIALLATIFLLVLTFLQTYYTIRSS